MNQECIDLFVERERFVRHRLTSVISITESGKICIRRYKDSCMQPCTCKLLRHLLIKLYVVIFTVTITYLSVSRIRTQSSLPLTPTDCTVKLYRLIAFDLKLSHCYSDMLSAFLSARFNLFFAEETTVLLGIIF